MELAVPIIPPTSPGGVIMHVNKVHSVKTIDRVAAKELGESVTGCMTSPTRWTPKTASSGSMGTPTTV
jgi:hypothetical protein